MIALVAKATAFVVGALAAPVLFTAPTQLEPGSGTTSPTAQVPPLSGIVIALDPGHQLGNHRFPAQTGRIVRAGRGLRKPCNTTGTAIPGGLPEATIAWRVVRDAEARLEGLGATVRLTRTVNSEHRWGPCVGARGRFPGSVDARLMVSVHVDGSTDTAARGFHVILPSRGHLVHPGIVGPSRRLALAVRHGFDAHRLPRSTYVGGGTALSQRSDLGTLDMSSVPVVMVELGNSHNPGDAARLSSRAGRQRYAASVVAGIRDFLGR